MIRIGTLAGKGRNTLDYIQNLIPLGFESFQINFWRESDGVDLERLAADLQPILSASNTVISSLAVFGNPLATDELDLQTLALWEDAIDKAHLFGTDLVCGFSGRVRGASVPDSIARYKEVWGPLAERAASRNVRIAFENCPMDGDWHSGDWNLAFCEDAWELLFDALDAPHIGLEWEPCHQLAQLCDPIPQLKAWMPRIFHVHGKDASVYHDVIRRYGLGGNRPIAQHRHPGFGDSNWTNIISILRAHSYTSTIDIEGWHDPVYRGPLEMTGQVHALNHLKQCRGGSFVPNPLHCV